jgi:hypothetical protein
MASIAETLRSIPVVADPYIDDKSIDQLLEDLVTVGQPGSARHEQIKAAIQVRMGERPRRWAMVSAIAACISGCPGFWTGCGTERNGGGASLSDRQRCGPAA